MSSIKIPFSLKSLVLLFLISLYNIQYQLEYPFDNLGMDDINLDIFKLDR